MPTQCPLCKQSGAVLLDRYPTDDLGRRWDQSYGFNPFAGRAEDALLKKQCATCDLVYFDPSFHGDDALYARLSTFPWYYETNKWEFDVAIRMIMDKRPGSFLEIGCGNGSFLEKIGSVVERVEGIDINEPALAACVRKGIRASSRPIHELDGTYDMIAMFEVLEHMDQLHETLQHIVDRLAPGGHLILAVPNPDGYLKEMQFNLLDMPPHHNSLWSKKAFAYLADAYGLSMLEYCTEPLRYLHYLHYVSHLVTTHRETRPRGLRRRVASVLQWVSVNALAPFAYIQQRHAIVGQTHLVMLGKGD